MKRAGNLFNSVVSFSNIYEAALRAAIGKKRKKEVWSFLMDLEKEVILLREELVNGDYVPRPLRTFEITDPKRRVISAAPFRDRVVHHALCNITEPFFERRYIFRSYACRKGKGTHKAISEAKRFSGIYSYYLKLDVRKFFASIDHERMMTILESMFKEKKLLFIFEQIIRNGSNIDKGLPIGNLTSQHLANLYLDRSDHFIKEELKVKGYLRYMDDHLIFADDKEKLQSWYGEIKEFLTSFLQLDLNSRVTTISPTWEGLNFLGFRIYPNMIRLQNRTKYRRWKKIRSMDNKLINGIISEEDYQISMQSITEHLKVGNTYHLRRDMFEHALGQGV